MPWKTRSNKLRSSLMSFNGRGGVGELLERRRKRAAERIKGLQERLAGAEKLCGDKVCVYATGSFARGEASEYSDLDIFIVGEGTPEKPALAPLDEILIKADLIETIRELKIQDFSGGGEYLTHHPETELIKSLGTPEEMHTTRLQLRLLLLLEEFAVTRRTRISSNHPEGHKCLLA